jgi:mono/diheme cytochrome c family protein
LRDSIIARRHREAAGDAALEVLLSPFRAGLSALAALVAVHAAPGRATEPAPRTTRDRVYTAEQAQRGKEVYQRVCSQCHALDFYKGPVMKPWDGGSLDGLYDAVSRLMPQNNPGSLKRREYVDILAYILSLNGMPAGEEEMPTKPADLKAIRIKWRSKP